MDELEHLTVRRLSEGIRLREFTVEQVVQSYINCTTRYNPALNAVVQFPIEQALERARSLDKELRQRHYRGPMHGIPWFIKDNIDVEGMISCTAGMLSRANNMPSKDAPVIAKLRNAGAVILGITNMPKLGMAGKTDNLLYGRTNNPYDLERTPGGSSGGAAAIIAVSGAPIALVTDIGGSARQPAAHCGLVGLKPTTGRTSREGHFPPPGGSTAYWPQDGLIASFVDDIAMGLPFIVNPGGIDPTLVPVSLNLAHRSLKKLRIAYYPDNGVVEPVGGIMKAVERASDILKERGAKVDYKLPRNFGMVMPLFLGILGGDGGARARKAWEAGPDGHDHLLYEEFLNILVDYQAKSAEEYEDRIGQVHKLRSDMLAFMQEYDAIICPVTATPALGHNTGFDDLKALGYTAMYNLTGLPAMSVPAGLGPDGMPIAVQVVGGPFREDIVIAVGRVLESTFGFLKPNL